MVAAAAGVALAGGVIRGYIPAAARAAAAAAPATTDNIYDVV